MENNVKSPVDKALLKRRTNFFEKLKPDSFSTEQDPDVWLPQLYNSILLNSFHEGLENDAQMDVESNATSPVRSLNESQGSFHFPTALFEDSVELSVDEKSIILDGELAVVLRFKKAISSQYPVITVVYYFYTTCDLIIEKLQEFASESIDIQSFLSFLKKERNTWRLLYELMNNSNLTTEDSSEDAEMIDDFDNAVNDKIRMDRFFRSSKQIQTAKAMLNWLENNAKEHFEFLQNKYSYITNNFCEWMETFANAKKPRYQHKFIRTDPDSVFDGFALASGDRVIDNKLLELVFATIRCGKPEEGQKLLADVGQYWRAVILSGNTFFEDCNIDADSPEIYPTVGNSNRSLWKHACSELIKRDELSDYERAIFASLVGNANFIWPVCKNIEDFWWSLCKKYLEDEFENYKTGKYCSRFSAIFDIVRENAPSFILDESREPIRQIQQFLILEEYSDLIKYVIRYLENNETVPLNVCRYMTHLVIILKEVYPNVCVQETTRINEIITHYVNCLLARGNCELLIPFYLSLLDTHASQVTALGAVLYVMETPQKKIEVLQECEQLEMEPDDGIASYLHERRNEMATSFTVVPFDQCTEVVDTDEDENLIQDLNLIGSHMVEVIVEHENALCRYFIGSGKISAANRALQTIDRRENIAQIHDPSKTALSYKKWLSNVNPADPTGCETANALFTDYEQMVIDLITDVNGWMNFHELSPGIRSAQIDSLRTTLVPSLIYNLLCAYECLGKYKEILNFLPKFLFTKYNVYQLLSQDQLKEILSMTMNASTHCLEHSMDAFGFEMSPEQQQST